jgi:hypothetical protein
LCNAFNFEKNSHFLEWDGVEGILQMHSP